MRIIELITFLAGGGAERLIVDLSNQLSKEHEIFLVTILDDKKDADIRNFYKTEISNDVHYLNLGLPNGLRLYSQWRVFQALKDLNPDVIHVHMIPTLNYSAIAIGLLSFSKKIYFSVHSDLHNGYDKGILKLYANTLGRINRFKLSCLSDKNYRDFKDFYPHTPIKCIENGRAPITSTSLFDTVKDEVLKLKNNASSLLLVHVARCHPVKNQKLLVDAVNTLVSHNENIDLIIIGDCYDTPLGKKIQSTSCERIHFIGVRKNIADYLLNADIFCLSSDYEGMPITLLEAGLAGMPAVSTPVCGAVDLIKNGMNGFISKDHTLDEYCIALKEAIDKFYIIKANAMNMKNISPYTIEVCAKKYIDYFNE